MLLLVQGWLLVLFAFFELKGVQSDEESTGERVFAIVIVGHHRYRCFIISFCLYATSIA